MGQINGVLLKEVAAFQKCPLTEVSRLKFTSYLQFQWWSNLTYNFSYIFL